MRSSTTDWRFLHINWSACNTMTLICLSEDFFSSLLLPPCLFTPHFTAFLLNTPPNFNLYHQLLLLLPPKPLTVVAATRKAFVVLKGSSSVEGVVTLTQDDEGPTTVSVRVAGLAPGKHGFHLHEYGDTTNGCISAGAHLIPRD